MEAVLVKRTSKNQITLPKALLAAAGVGREDDYFSAEYDEKEHLIRLKPVKVVIEEKVPEQAIERFEQEAAQLRLGDKLFKSRKEADKFLEGRSKR